MDFTKGIQSVLLLPFGTVKKNGHLSAYASGSLYIDEPRLCHDRFGKKRPAVKQVFLKASIGIEPMHRGFADLSLTTWV